MFSQSLSILVYSVRQCQSTFDRFAVTLVCWQIRCHIGLLADSLVYWQIRYHMADSHLIDDRDNLHRDIATGSYSIKDGKHDSRDTVPQAARPAVSICCPRTAVMFHDQLSSVSYLCTGLLFISVSPSRDFLLSNQALLSPVRANCDSSVRSVIQSRAISRTLCRTAALTHIASSIFLEFFLTIVSHLVV